MDSDFHFYGDIFRHVDDALESYVSEVAANIIFAITPVATQLLMIYMVLWGWSMMRGMIQEPVADGAIRLIRLAVISGVALSVGRYNGFIADFLWRTPDALAQFVAAGHEDGRGDVQFLDQLMGKMYRLGDRYSTASHMSAGLLPDFGLLLTGFAIWAAGLVATGYGAFLLALSKTALAVLLGIGPIFVLLLIFDGTKRFFESWMSQALNYVFLVVLSAASIKLILSVLDSYIGAVGDTGVLAVPSIKHALPALAMCVIAALVMMQLPSISAVLGGGMAVSTLGTASWAVARARAGATALRSTQLKRGFVQARTNVKVGQGQGQRPGMGQGQGQRASSGQGQRSAQHQSAQGRGQANSTGSAQAKARR